MPGSGPAALTASSRPVLPRHPGHDNDTVTTNPLPSARNTRICMDIANAAFMDILKVG